MASCLPMAGSEMDMLQNWSRAQK